MFFTSPAREALSNLVKKTAFIESHGRRKFPGTNSSLHNVTEEGFSALDVRSGLYQDLPILRDMVFSINTEPVLDSEQEERISEEIDEWAATRLGAFEDSYDPNLQTLLVSQREEIEKGSKYTLTARYVFACVRACVSVCVCACALAHTILFGRTCVRDCWT